MLWWSMTALQPPGGNDDYGQAHRETASSMSSTTERWLSAIEFKKYLQQKLEVLIS